jgi:hypothetical protein
LDLVVISKEDRQLRFLELQLAKHQATQASHTNARHARERPELDPHVDRVLGTRQSTGGRCELGVTSAASGSCHVRTGYSRAAVSDIDCEGPRSADENVVWRCDRVGHAHDATVPSRMT